MITLIFKTGVLHKINEKLEGEEEQEQEEEKQNPWDDAGDIFFQSLMISIPLTTLHSGLDYVIHTQYSFGG